MQLLTVKQVAAMLQLGERSVWRFRDSGRMPKALELGRRTAAGGASRVVWPIEQTACSVNRPLGDWQPGTILQRAGFEISVGEYAGRRLLRRRFLAVALYVPAWKVGLFPRALWRLAWRFGAMIAAYWLGK